MLNTQVLQKSETSAPKAFLVVGPQLPYRFHMFIFIVQMFDFQICPFCVTHPLGGLLQHDGDLRLQQR